MDRINNFQSFKGENLKRPADTPYSRLQTAYSDYLKQNEKSDLANSPSRFIIELNFVKNLKNLAKEINDKDGVEKWNKKETEIREKLNQWGIQMDN